MDPKLSDIVATWISDGLTELSVKEYATLLKSMVDINVNTTIYRGLNINERQIIGPNKQLTSWSFDKSVAEDFGDIVLEWKPETPIMGLDISSINYHEKEIIVCTK